jgi:cell division protein ZapA (FtsZ GTPase activity inhibitor)
MLEKRSLTISVFGRQFPAKVDSEEAVVIEKAARAINAKIKAFKAEYKTQDDLDIAIMCCLDIMTEYLSHKVQSERQSEEILTELSRLEEKLDTSLTLSEKKS